MAGYEFSVDTKELNQFVRDLSLYNIRTKIAIRRTIRSYGNKAKNQVIKNASGRPGPRKVTGEYVKSIYAKPGLDTQGDFSIAVGSDAPQAARLEFGFVGRDSLGRMYNQPPFPHFSPALALLEPMLMKDMADLLSRAWGKRAF